MTVSFEPISRSLGVPLREQVRALLARQIENGTLEPGERLPTEAELAAALDVSLAPIRSALSDLADAGMILRQAGLGTFVTERPIAIEIDLLPSFTQTLRSANIEFETRVLTRERARLDDDLAALFEPSPIHDVVWIRRSATISGHRSVVLDSWLPWARFERILNDDRLDEPGRSLYTYLADEYGVQLRPGAGRLSVTPCGNDLLPYLDVSFGAPLAVYQTRGVDGQGCVAEVTRIYYDASRFVFTINKDREDHAGDTVDGREPIA